MANACAVNPAAAEPMDIVAIWIQSLARAAAASKPLPHRANAAAPPASLTNLACMENANVATSQEAAMLSTVTRAILLQALAYAKARRASVAPQHAVKTNRVSTVSAVVVTPKVARTIMNATRTPASVRALAIPAPAAQVLAKMEIHALTENANVASLTLATRPIIINVRQM